MTVSAVNKIRRLGTFDFDAWADLVLSQMYRPGFDGGGHEVTWADYYCGAGGSSSGLHAVPGARVVMASNHWELAIATHQHNFPDTDHDIADITGVDPRRHPRTDLAWFSPECTTWSAAAGGKCDYDGEDGVVIDGYLDDGSDGDPDRPAAVEAKVRSRVQMRDVVRFAAYHHYRGVIVENVPDILKWANLDRWLGEMRTLGYKYKTLTLNSAFAHGLGLPAPQLRDRVYFVFWKSQYRTPNWDKWLRPHAWCPGCDRVVRGIYTAKPGPRRPMKYGKGGQYFYRCPNRCGTKMVQPFVMPAMSAIDLSKPTQRIRDRERPLAPNTRARIAAGLARYRNYRIDPTVPMLVPTGGNRNGKGDQGAVMGDRPLRTRTTREWEAVVTMPPLTVSTVGRDNSGRARNARTEPLRAQTTRHEEAVVQPELPLYMPLRRNGVAHPAATVPTKTIAAGGEHHAVVMRYKTGRGGESRCTTVDEPVRALTAGGGGAGQSVIQWGSDALVMRNNGGGAEMSTPLDEPVRTLTCAGHQSVIGRTSPGAGLYCYDTGALRPLGQPMPTQTTVDGDAVFEPGDEVDECTLRMLAVDEIQGGMAFPRSFVLLGDAKRDKVRMLGNAVTPPASRDLAACLMEAVLGYEYELFEFGLAA